MVVCSNLMLPKSSGGRTGKSTTVIYDHYNDGMQIVYEAQVSMKSRGCSRTCGKGKCQEVQPTEAYQ